ncbi:uncharacterized protein LOC118745669 [Rhagoletis pomonella]|uniref:uncharacterized protein LOC118745669 n=1 Tax=Rhagoletis pomonella TaxID=28610 RepID=UPI00177C95D1|nr:uncharacterized protein LOC118745669 [Rhagoletis pomonella]
MGLERGDKIFMENVTSTTLNKVIEIANAAEYISHQNGTAEVKQEPNDFCLFMQGNSNDLQQRRQREQRSDSSSQQRSGGGSTQQRQQTSIRNGQQSATERQQQEPQQQHCTVESQRTRKRKKSDNNSEFLEKAIQHLDQAKNSNRERDDADVFAESWAILFRKLSAEQQIYAKRGIEEILVHGQLGNLHMNSVQITVSQRNPRTYTISRASTPCSSSSIPDPFPTVYTQAPQLLISRRTMPRNEYSQSGFAESPEFIHSNNSGSAQSFDELFSDAQYQ